MTPPMILLSMNFRSLPERQVNGIAMKSYRRPFMYQYRYTFAYIENPDVEFEIVFRSQATQLCDATDEEAYDKLADYKSNPDLWEIVKASNF